MAKEQPKPDLCCPRCDNPIHFIEQLEDWLYNLGAAGVNEDGKIWSCPPPVWTALWCEVCQDMTTSWFWEENDQEEHVEAPALRDLTGGLDDVVISFPSSMRSR